MSIGSLLNPADEDGIIEPTTVEYVGSYIASSQSFSEDLPDINEDDNNYTTEKKLRELAVAESALKRLKWTTESIRKTLRGFQRKLQLAKQFSMLQLQFKTTFVKA